MRTQLFFYAILTLFPLICSADVTLTDTNGVAATGTITTYSPRSDSVKLRQDGQTCSFSFSALTPESRRQVVCWRSDKNFDSRSSLDVSFQQKDTHTSTNIVGTVTDRITNKNTEQTIGYEDRQFCTYKFQITNTSDTPFEDLVADYRVFFTQQLTEEYTGKYQLAGTAERDQLDAGSTWTFSSTNFLSGISYWEARGINWTGMPRSSETKIQGVVLRIRKRGLDGKWIEREVEHAEPPRKRDRSDYQKVYK